MSQTHPLSPTNARSIHSLKDLSIENSCTYEDFDAFIFSLKPEIERKSAIQDTALHGGRDFFCFRSLKPYGESLFDIWLGVIVTADGHVADSSPPNARCSLY
jgi:hypothetical protein